MVVLPCPCCGLNHAGNLLQRCVEALGERVKELESKLGAVAAEQTASASGVPEGPAVRLDGPGVSGTAAPSVSVEQWLRLETLHRAWDSQPTADACDLAAAVTECCKRGLDVNWLCRIALAFFHGEPLPEKGE